MSGEEFSAGLWQVRCQMELLLFNLDTQLVHLSQRSLRWLPFTTEAIEPVLERLRFETLALHVESASLASAWGGSAEAGLPGLVALAPPGVWPVMLEDHRLALVGLANEISSSRSQNEHALGALAAELSASAERPETDGPEQLISQANVNRALDVLARSALPQLSDFLGRTDS